MRKILGMPIAVLVLVSAYLIGIAHAEGAAIDGGDTAWLIVATAMVFIMIPGIGFFYSGMVRRKNAVSTIMLTFATLALISIEWVLYGYSLSFGPDISGFLGNLSYVGLIGVGMEPIGTIPHLLFVMFQGTFSMVTVALIVGGIIERVKFSAWLLLALLWATFVYNPIAHWVWGGGWLSALGALDFAGGTVVHINSGVSALAIALVVGARRSFRESLIEPHNLPMAILGAILLWFGWFGFNAGSALAASGIAANALIATNTAAASAALTWMLLSWKDKAPSAIGTATGAIAGLVAITPAAGYVTPLASLLIGIGAGIFCYYAMLLRIRKGVDESLDVWAVHGVGGTWGAIATGIFASIGAQGLIAGNPHQVIVQLVAVSATWLYAFVITYFLAKLIDKTVGLRVTEEEEEVGLDLAQHGEKAYA